MDLNFAAALATLVERSGPDFPFRMINEARTADQYLLQTFLPEELRATYDAKSGSMTIVATMVGLVGMDSKYPPGGAAKGTKFLERTAKLAQDIRLPEETIRELHQLVLAMGQQAGSNEVAVNTVLNFQDKILSQAQYDTSEWMRGKVLSTGKLQWTFNGIELDVDYGVPAANIFAQRTGTAGYGGSASAFWTDYRLARTKLKGRIRAVVSHPETIDMIVSNEANKLELISQDEVTGTAEFVKYVGDPSTGPRLRSSDVRDRTRIIGYGAEGTIIDPDNPGSTLDLPFIPRGVVIYIGDVVQRGLTVGLGSNVIAENNPVRLGYTHIAPTVEGGGRPGRWSRMYIPDDLEMQLGGKTASNQLPVVEAPDKLVVANTVMV
jgi:hypothetical protein